jgi:hypothetical protein
VFRNVNVDFAAPVSALSSQRRSIVRKHSASWSHHPTGFRQVLPAQSRALAAIDLLGARSYSFPTRSQILSIAGTLSAEIVRLSLAGLAAPPHAREGHP